MDGLSSVFNLLAYLAAVIFVLGFLIKIVSYLKTPSPPKVPSTPDPNTLGGVIMRFLIEVFFFRSLLKAGTSEKVLWLGGWVFHVCFLLILLRHLRFFTYPVPGFIMSFQQVGIWAGIVFPLALLILIVISCTSERVAIISLFSDYFIFMLITGIGLTGLLLKYFIRINLVDVKAFILGLLTLSPTRMPDSTLFLIHFSLVLVLLMYLPFSKLMHAWGVLISQAKGTG